MALISIVMHDLRGGGAEKMMVRLANQLAEAGDSVDLVLLGSTAGKGGANKAFVSTQVSLLELNCRRTMKAYKPLRHYLLKRHPDAILSVLTHVNVITSLVCWRLGMAHRLTVSERNTFSLDRKLNRSLTMRSTYFAAPFIYRLLPNPVLAVSGGVADDLVACSVVRQSDVVTAPNPVISRDTLFASQQAEQHPWLTNKQGKVVIAVGRLSYQKGFDMLLNAFAAMPQDCRLVIMGEGEDRHALEVQIQSLGLASRVDLPGYCDNPLAEIRQADLFVLSSRFEGSPNGLVEAMSVGTAVVAFDCPHGPKEILSAQSVKGAQLVPYLNVEALSQAMATQLSCDSDENQRKRIRHSVAAFHAESAAKAYREVLLARQISASGQSVGSKLSIPQVSGNKLCG